MGTDADKKPSESHTVRIRAKQERGIMQYFIEEETCGSARKRQGASDKSDKKEQESEGSHAIIAQDLRSYARKWSFAKRRVVCNEKGRRRNE